MNFWQGDKIKLRAIEPSDAEVFFLWNQDSQRARNLDFVWPPSSRAAVQGWVEEMSKYFDVIWYGMTVEEFHAR